MDRVPDEKHVTTEIYSDNAAFRKPNNAFVDRVFNYGFPATFKVGLEGEVRWQQK
jgi:hypothetical protein